jgi:hypothetical protein
VGGMIALPQRFLSQPQYQVPVAQRFQAFSPKIAVLPASAVNITNGKSISFANDATRKGGNFYFPGANGYVDLGSDAFVGSTNFSFVVVSKLDSFPGSFPVVLGLKTTAGTNLAAFYSNSAAYIDFTVGQNGIGDPFSLTPFGSVTGTWHSFVYTNNGAGKLFCNGVQATKGAANSLAASSGNTVLGQSNPGNLANDFNGSIACFALFNGVLPDDLARQVSANPWQIFQAPARRIWASDASSDVSVGLTGQSASLARGTLAPSTTVALTGRSLTSAQGSVKPALSVSLTGQALTSAKGALGVSASVALSGQALASARGTLSPATSVALSGRILASAQGTLSVSGAASVALSGQSLTSAQGTLTPLAASNVALTGQQLSSAQGTLGPGNSVALSGQYLTSNQGSVSAGTAVTLSGQTATLAQGSLGITGDRSVQLTGIQSSLLMGSLTPSIGAVSSLVERTAIFHQIVSRSTKFQRSKAVTVRFN